MDPSTIGNAQASAQIMRIGYAIEHQQKRLAFDAINQLG
jgi:hypothetical protein